jgi:dihydropyrimidinase
MGDLYIQNGSVVFQNSVSVADIYVCDGKITYIGDPLELPEKSQNCTVIDADGLYVFPGFIDAHTHYGVGSGESASVDNFYTGTKAAAFGGITTVIDFADQLPDKKLLEGTLARIDDAKDSVIDYALHQGVYRFSHDLDLEIAELAAFGVRVLKIFTTYKEMGLYLDSAYWNSLFALCKKYQLLVTVHAESQRIIDHESEQHAKNNDLPSTYHAILRPPKAEAEAIYEIGNIAKKHEIPLYFVHVSSFEGLQAIRSLRKCVCVCAETTPHYLLLNSDMLSQSNGNLSIMTPPLRSKKDNELLLEAISQKEIQIIATDHCAYSYEQKMRSKDCRYVPAGIPGSETLASLVYSYLVKTGCIGLSEMRKILCDNPAKIFGLYPRKGSLQIGSDADIVLYHAGHPRPITISALHGGSDYTPYEGVEISGEIVYTIAKGKIIVNHGEFYGIAGDGNFLSSKISSLFRTTDKNNGCYHNE